MPLVYLHFWLDVSRIHGFVKKKTTIFLWQYREQTCAAVNCNVNYIFDPQTIKKNSLEKCLSWCRDVISSLLVVVTRDAIDKCDEMLYIWMTQINYFQSKHSIVIFYLNDWKIFSAIDWTLFAAVFLLLKLKIAPMDTFAIIILKRAISNPSALHCNWLQMQKFTKTTFTIAGTTFTMKLKMNSFSTYPNHSTVIHQKSLETSNRIENKFVLLFMVNASAELIPWTKCTILTQKHRTQWFPTSFAAQREPRTMFI